MGVTHTQQVFSMDKLLPSPSLSPSSHKEGVGGQTPFPRRQMHVQGVLQRLFLGTTPICEWEKLDWAEKVLSSDLFMKRSQFIHGKFQHSSDPLSKLNQDSWGWYPCISQSWVEGWLKEVSFKWKQFLRNRQARRGQQPSLLGAGGIGWGPKIIYPSILCRRGGVTSLSGFSPQG